MSKYVLEIKNIKKVFPGVIALDNVSLYFKKGEVHALLGENGAGKSTLMKILAGIYQPDEGQIILKGRLFRARKPVEALKSGISMVQQELDLVPDLTVQENIFLGSEIVNGLFLNAKEMYIKTKDVLSQLELEISPGRKVKDLSVSQCQMVAIAKALVFDAEIIIMDEPTSAITKKEVKQLFKIINKLKIDGKTIVYISHKMDEIYEISDRISVLRDGKYIGSLNTSEASEEIVVNMLVGRSLENMFQRKIDTSKSRNDKKMMLKVTNLSRKKEFTNISFDVYAGEIVGIFGLLGAGRTEIVETIFGLRKRDCGSVQLKEKEIKNINDSINNGLGFITEDRKDQGLNLIASVKNNISLVYLEIITKFKLFLNLIEEGNIAKEYISKLRIKTSSMDTPVGTLSGGNQQKVVISKWLVGNPDVLIMDEPTRGIDIGAKAEIYNLMDDFVKQDKSIIMISSETPELLGVSDRILVVHQGKIVGDMVNDNLTQEKIMDLAIGLGGN